MELKIDETHGRLVQLLKYTECEERHHKALHSTVSRSWVSKGKVAVRKTLWRSTSNFGSLEERDKRLAILEEW